VEGLGSGILWYLGFLISVTCHEAAHAYAALLGGDSTAYEGGQVTLDPEPHMRRSPVGMIVMPILSIMSIGWPLGFASAPYNVAWADRHPKRAAWMALAGPGANLVLVLIAGIAIKLGELSGVFLRSTSPSFDSIVSALDQGLWPGAAHVLSIVFSMNLILFSFNMLPVPPLDGSTALGLFFDDDTARKVQNMMRKPAFSLVGLLLAWNFFGPVFREVFLFALNAMFPGANYGVR